VALGNRHDETRHTQKAAGATRSVLVGHRQEVGRIRGPMFWCLSTSERVTLGKCVMKLAVANGANLDRRCDEVHRTITQLPRRPREGNSARRLAVVRAIRTTGTLLGDTRAKLALGLHRKTEGSVAASQYKPAIPNPVLM
jgi:hypothetical protein